MKDFEGGFFKAPNDIFEIGLDPYQIAVYSYLVRCSNNSEAAFPAFDTIATKSGMSERKAKSVVKELVQMGLLQSKRRGGKSNSYTVVDPAQSAQYALSKVHDMHNQSAQDAQYKELSYKELDYKEKRYIDFYEIDDEYLKIYNLYFQRKFNKPHMRVTEEQLDHILNNINELRSWDIDKEWFEEEVEKHFDELAATNNGNIIAFIRTFMRRFEVHSVD